MEAHMRKLQNWIGLPVLEIEGGGQIGEVHEVVLNLVQATVVGIELSDAGWFMEKRGILFQDIYGLGRDAVTVNDAAVIQELTGYMESSEIGTLGDICGKLVYTDAGDYLGTVMDIACDPITGEIRWYELSDGFVTDVLYGRMSMPHARSQVTSGEKIIVPAAISQLLHTTNQEPGGVG
jgi:uncharacterized protein YrrD